MRIFVLFLCLLSSCGRNQNCNSSILFGPAPESCNPQPKPCSTSKHGNIATISCPDGTTTSVTDGLPAPQSSPGPVGALGATGATGSKGTAGAIGHSVVFDTALASTLQCPNGGSIILMATDTNDNGLFDVTDENLKSALICNGIDGQNGATGSQGATGQTGPTGATGSASPYAPVGVILACGASSSPYKEVLLCLSDGSLLASFSENSGGKNTRLALIPPGSYGNTDSSGCVFTVTHSLSGSVVSWNAGNNQYSTWTADTAFCAAY